MTPSARTRSSASALFAAILAAIAPVSRASAQTTLVIYADGRVLVRQNVAVAVPRGGSRHRIELDQFDPGSLVALDSGVTITDVQYPAVVDEATLYRASIGRRLLFQRPESGDTVSALVVGEEPPRFELVNGQVRLTAPGIPLFPKELAGTSRPTVISVESGRALPRLAIGYLTEGATWRAEYSIVLGESSAEVTGRIVVSSGTLRADSAEVKVLEGQVGRASGFSRERPRIQLRGETLLEEMAVTGIRPASASFALREPLGVGGFRIYSVPGRLSLSPGHTTVATLFSPIRVAIERVHTVAGDGIAQGQPERSLPVELHYRLMRPRESPFGAQAIPPGLVRLYGRAPDGSLLVVGEAAVARGDPGSALDLMAGSALTVTARKLPTRLTVVPDSVIGTDRRPQVYAGGQVAEVEVRFANVADTAAVVEISERLAGQGRMVSSSVPAEAQGDGTVRFRVRVPARGEASLKYRLRISP